jgi:hypothetical protein
MGRLDFLCYVYYYAFIIPVASLRLRSHVVIVGVQREQKKMLLGSGEGLYTGLPKILIFLF